MYERRSSTRRNSIYPGWGSGQYGPYGDPAGPETPAQGEPVTPAGLFS
jgi:hypothetical protein